MVYQPELWLRTHTLQDLDQAVPKSVQPTTTPQTGLGRNVDLFAAMVKEAHRPRWAETLAGQGWGGAWLGYVRGQNEVLFPGAALPDSECRSIARSCYRYWAKQYNPARFSARQVARNGKRWHGDYRYDFEERDASIRSLAQVGFKQREIAEIVELSRSRVANVLRNVRPITVIPAQKAMQIKTVKEAGPRTVQCYQVVKACLLCDGSRLHRPGPVLCLCCGSLSRAGRRRWQLPPARPQYSTGRIEGP